MSKSKLTLEQENEMVELRKQGWGYKRLSQKYGLDKNAIRNRMRRIGLGNVNAKVEKRVDYASMVNNSECGCKAIEEYLKGTQQWLKLECNNCGCTFERLAANVGYTSKAGHKVRCPECFKYKKRETENSRLRRLEQKKTWAEQKEKHKQKALDLWFETNLTQTEIRKECGCSSDVVKEIAREYPNRYSKECYWCKGLFYTKKPNQIYCCNECKISAENANSRKHWDARRTLLKKATEEPERGSITLLRVSYRDNNTCYLCGQKCNPFDFKVVNGKTVVGGSYPSIDHVVPLCKGGKNTWENVRLACKRCNTHKAMAEVT